MIRSRTQRVQGLVPYPSKDDQDINRRRMFQRLLQIAANYCRGPGISLGIKATPITARRSAREIKIATARTSRRQGFADLAGTFVPVHLCVRLADDSADEAVTALTNARKID
jgi:hypothetical protein